MQCLTLLGHGATFALIANSASGNKEFKQKFASWTKTMADVLTHELNVPVDHVLLLTEDGTQSSPYRVAKSTKPEFMRALDILRSLAKEDDSLLILLLGHGTFDGSEYKFNLVGPDISGSELKTYLQRFKQQVILVASTSCSGPLIRVLSGPGRVIITATKSEFENNDTVFAEYFVEGFKGHQADTDKNGRVTVLEAYQYATHKVEAWFKENGRLATEHALIEDTGDRNGVAQPSPANGEGLLASKIALGDETAPSAVGLATRPELQQLQTAKKRLEDDIQALKYNKDHLPAAEYDRQLESLLVKLAQTNQKIKSLEKP